MQRTEQPWIYSARFDTWTILSPAFLVSAIVILLSDRIDALDEVPLWAWVILVMGIDVAHVYSTLFRTYLDPDEMEQRRALYLCVPVLCWFFGVVLYAIGPLVFWRTLAYIAVFHFIRQQYGFMMIYGRNDSTDRLGKLLDRLVIYLATIYPIAYWHMSLPRKFAWFVEGDFVALSVPWVLDLLGGLYLVTLGAYFFKELLVFHRSGSVNLPKNLLLIGTALSWYLGIVAFNGDLAFTLTNVVAHGVPYIALIWIYCKKKWDARRVHNMTDGPLPTISKLFSLRTLPVFIGALLILAYFEEALWDGFVWREHQALFGILSGLPEFSPSETLLWLVPLLAVPQATHYILDGFIWKLGNPDTGMKRLVSSPRTS